MVIVILRGNRFESASVILIRLWVRLGGEGLAGKLAGIEETGILSDPIHEAVYFRVDAGKSFSAAAYSPGDDTV